VLVRLMVGRPLKSKLANSRIGEPAKGEELPEAVRLLRNGRIGGASSSSEMGSLVGCLDKVFVLDLGRRGGGFASVLRNS